MQDYHSSYFHFVDLVAMTR